MTRAVLEKHIINFCGLSAVYCRAKVKNMFLRHRPRHLKPAASKKIIVFPVFTLKNRLYIVNGHFKLAIICHFVCFWFFG